MVSEEPFIQLAKLATHLERLKPRFEPILSKLLSEDEVNRRPDRDTGFELVKLGEDALLCGFYPWFRGLDWAVYRRFGPRSVPSELAQGARRLEAILFCIEYLEGLEKPILRWSQADKAHISLAETAFSPQDRAHARLTNMLSKEQDILEESYSDEESVQPPPQPQPSQQPHSSEDSELYRLKHRKNELERRRAEEEKEARRAQRQILSEHVSVTLEVRPRLVVPDTNCFVDHLTEITRLASSGVFQVRIPLVVLNELDGLSRGAPAAKYASQDHAAMVQESAGRALAYLRERPPNTKCLTSRGNVIASLGVTTEEDGGEGKKNDDLILDTCVSLASQQHQHQDSQQQRLGSSSSENMRHVYREVVLLTEDRNLRLKAHLMDVPVNKVTDFMRWAFGGESGGGRGEGGNSNGQN